jgi:DNA-binding transcriptional ArsR family regulator
MADEARERAAHRHVRVLPTVIEDRRLGHATFRVYCCLKSFANAEGVCWPSVSTIGTRLGMARSTVSEHLAILARCGHLRSEPTSRRDKGRSVNLYRFAPMSDRPTGGMSDQPTAQFGSSDIPCRNSTAPPVGTADIELDHQNITIQLSPPAARARGSLDDYFPGEEISAWAAGHREFIRFAGEHPPGLDPLDREIIDDFKDWHRVEGKSSQDWGASYKRWLRRELRLRTNGRRGRSGNEQPRSMLEVALDEVTRSEEVGCTDD